MVNIVAELFFKIFGNGAIMALFVVGTFVGLLLMMRANVMTIALVVAPLLLTFIVAPKISNFIEITPWVYPLVFLFMGIIASLVIIQGVLSR